MCGGRGLPWAGQSLSWQQNQCKQKIWGSESFGVSFFGSELWLAISRAGMVWVVAASRNVLGLCDSS